MKYYKIHPLNVATVRHIFDTRIDHAITEEEYYAYCLARDVIEYMLANNAEVLQSYDSKECM